MNTTLIPIASGGYTRVDDDIADRLQGRTVGLYSRRYPSVTIDGKTVPVHRFVMAPPAGLVVDHIDGDPLNNTRANLRVVTQTENVLNQRKSRASASGYRGVYRESRGHAWLLKINRHHKHLFFGHSWRSNHVAGLFMDGILGDVVGPFVATNFARSIPRGRVCRFIAETRGRIFTVVFSRRSDGTQRVMTCRTGVKSHSKGGASSYSPCLCGLALVWDLQSRGYRTIPVKRVIAIRFAKINYRIEGNHESKNAKSRRAA